MVDIKITTILVGLIIVGFLVTGIFQFVGDLGEGYNTPVDDTPYIKIYDKTNETAEKLSQSYSNITDQEISQSSAFFIGANLAWSGLKTAVTAPFNLLGAMITSSQSVLPIPAWATGLLSVFVILIIVMGFIAFLRGWQP